MMAASTRYAGKPLLRLLELYILRSLGELSESDELRLREMTPKLQSVYNLRGEWQEIIEAVLQLPENMSALIQKSWETKKNEAVSRGGSLTAQQFAESLADQFVQS